MNRREEVQKVYLQNDEVLKDYNYTDLDKYYVKKLHKPKLNNKQDILKSYKNIMYSYRECRKQNEELKSIIHEKDEMVKKFKSKN